jgi:hypothetical protein
MNAWVPLEYTFFLDRNFKSDSLSFSNVYVHRKQTQWNSAASRYIHIASTFIIKENIQGINLIYVKYVFKDGPKKEIWIRIIKMCIWEFNHLNVKTVEKISPKILISKFIKKNVVYLDFIIICKNIKIEMI